MKRRTSLICVAFLSIVACEKKPDIVGKWQENKFMGGIINFKSDGHFELSDSTTTIFSRQTSKENSSKGSYSLNGNNLTMKIETVGDMSAKDYSSMIDKSMTDMFPHQKQHESAKLMKDNLTVTATLIEGGKLIMLTPKGGEPLKTYARIDE